MAGLRRVRSVVAVAGLALLASTGMPAAEAKARTVVPGAEQQVSVRLDDLTTAGTVGTGHTDPADWAGLSAAGTRNPSGVPGVQIDGYFPDTSTFNSTHGWNHDAQFVIRLPDRWNGGIVVAGTPGNREQYANDVTISDWVLANGYAYAATDKGNVGTSFFRDGRRPGDAIAEWNARLTQLARAAKLTTASHYGRAPRTTYVAGISNGGYLVRWQLENHPELYDGGVDWEGTLWRADGPNLFTYLPTAIREYPSGDQNALLQAGFADGSQFLWEFHYRTYWELTQRIYREELDPSYAGAEADYVYADRPPAVRRSVERIALTGELRRPLITLHGTLDALLPASLDSDVYAGMVENAVGDRDLFRYYRVEGGNHVDGLYDTYPERLRPILPCFRSAFSALERWPSTPPPDSGTIPMTSTDVNSCRLPGKEKPTSTEDGVYVAGVSAGGYMADQLHVAHSGTFEGVGIFSAGPYHCARGNLTTAQLACMNDIQDDRPEELEQLARDRSEQGSIDSVGNLSGHPVWIYHGTNDSTVKESVNDDLAGFYETFGANVSYAKTSPAGHAWISPLGRNPCSSSYSPYVNDCGDDPPGAMLGHLFGSVNEPSTAPTGTLDTIDQNAYAPGGDANSISMSTTGYVYTPEACRDGASCRLLVALHGCQQSADTIGTGFVETVHLNEYADTNQMIVLYPQATSSGENPNGCWNWWGYGGDAEYDTQAGAQIRTIMAMVHAH